MKKLLLACVFALCALAVAQAQPGRMMYGIKGGLNLPNMRNLDVESMSLTSAHAGLFYNVRFGQESRGRFQTELLYSRQGADLRDDRQKMKLDYVTLPLALQLGLGRSERPFYFGVYLEGGVQLGYLLAGKMEYEDQETVSIEEYYSKINPDIKVNTTDIAAMAGIGFNMGYSYQISWRYVWGLTPVVDLPNVSEGISNKMFQLSMAIAF